nr:hypothetical protein [Tanacetum cinerariifolium]
HISTSIYITPPPSYPPLLYATTPSVSPRTTTPPTIVAATSATRSDAYTITIIMPPPPSSPQPPQNHHLHLTVPSPPLWRWRCGDDVAASVVVGGWPESVADNDLYAFKECYFPILCINDIEDMQILIVHSRLTNLSNDDVFNFAIALRMFTRSIVIQKQVEDLQLAVESYQKKINVTKPETTRHDIRKKDPYTPYKDP